MIKVGINGFGRIGRIFFRAYLDYYRRCKIMRVQPNFVITAVNNPLKKGQTVKSFTHLLKYDSVHGKLRNNIEAFDSHFMIDGLKVDFWKETDPAQINWSDSGVSIVVDSTGVFKTKEALSKHLKGSVKRVIMSAPGEDLDGTFVMGVNDHDYDPLKHVIISNASCTTNCLAPLAKILDEAFGIEHGLVSTCHSVTNDQSLTDNIHDDLRRARAAFQSMILTKTGAAKAVGEVLPNLKGKLDGMAIRVPTLDVSVIDANFILKKDTSAEEVNNLLREKAKGDYLGILGVEDEELVSVDFVGDTRSSIVDSKYTKVMNKRMLKVMSWYDNEMGYSSRMVDMIKMIIDKGV